MGIRSGAWMASEAGVDRERGRDGLRGRSARPAWVRLRSPIADEHPQGQRQGGGPLHAAHGTEQRRLVRESMPSVWLQWLRGAGQMACRQPAPSRYTRVPASELRRSAWGLGPGQKGAGPAYAAGRSARCARFRRKNAPRRPLLAARNDRENGCPKTLRSETKRCFTLARCAGQQNARY